jgi:hypothetical protein
MLLTLSIFPSRERNEGRRTTHPKQFSPKMDRPPSSLLSAKRAHPLLHTDHSSWATTQSFQRAEKSRTRRRARRIPFPDRSSCGARLRGPFEPKDGLSGLVVLALSLSCGTSSPGPAPRRVPAHARTQTGEHGSPLTSSGRAAATSSPLGALWRCSSAFVAGREHLHHFGDVVDQRHGVGVGYLTAPRELRLEVGRDELDDLDGRLAELDAQRLQQECRKALLAQ